ncbi:MAG: ComEC/Rec2 family competence protein [Prevotella sp.]|nr:ComEC/Rec2 family competence protein [Prevotella sp.]
MRNPLRPINTPLLPVVILLVVVIAIIRMMGPDERRVPDGQWTEAVVASVPADKPKTLQLFLLLTETGERRRCYIWKDEHSQQLRAGDDLMVCISDGQFVRYDGWRRGGDGRNNIGHLQRLRIKALMLRERLLSRLRVNDDDDEAQALIAAMVLGDKSALTPELRNRYSITGASHVLALSGLHLSIIYLLLTRLTLGRRRSWLIQIVVLTAVWTYALLTGLPTSLIRAATMITVYGLFSLGGRRRASLNILCFTAIIMLLADSSALFDVGFQLSFMAMLGILLFTPLMESWMSARWMMEHRILSWVLSLLMVSVAAQMGTAPLVAYYFGRFSTWFLVTNLIVIPLTTLLLYAALASFILPVIGGVAVTIAHVMNKALDTMTTWPLASIEGLHPSVLQVAMCYVVVAAVYVLLTYSQANARYR